MDITYNYVPLFIDNDWSLVSIVPPNLNSQIKQPNLNTSLISSIYDEFKTDKSIIDLSIDKSIIDDITNLNTNFTNLNNLNNDIKNLNNSNIIDSIIPDSNLNSSSNDITIAEIYDTETEKKSILDLGNLKSKNRYVDKKNVLLGFGN
jgi:hypothetical protein